ncbi:MAG TPA: A/G-specific adenine glycosylase [Methanocorpusculum sp.]|nr:A/G-specific adenine glycosylase [Methanocorpusculum sp.]
MQTKLIDEVVAEPDFRSRFSKEGVTENLMQDFRDYVFAFYEKNGRHEMQWRHTTDPYKIIVSEVMLQQTQVPRVAIVYPKFIERFPTIDALANASAEEVLAAWQGMGYNRRVLNLQKLCKTVLNEYKGFFPQEPEKLVKLPGIGPATSCSIAAFAWNRDVIFIETNIRRVFIHYFFPPDAEVDDSELLPLVSAALPKGKARKWYWALMDLGTEMKTKMPNPNRRSRQYVKQSKFEGSNRQLRGAVLKKMLDLGKADAGFVAESLKADGNKVTAVLEKMADEGFFVREADGVYKVGK